MSRPDENEQEVSLLMHVKRSCTNSTMPRFRHGWILEAVTLQEAAETKLGLIGEIRDCVRGSRGIRSCNKSAGLSPPDKNPIANAVLRWNRGEVQSGETLC